jgi:DNA-binding GntR family transcriptional regulator
MTFIAPQSLPEQIAEHIREKIIRFELKPGENIREAQLAAELQVSRSPVREALKLLEKQRLVEQTPRKGTKVTGLSKDFLTSLYNIISVLIVLAAKECTQKATPDDLKKINQTVLNAADAVHRKDIHDYYTAFFDFCLNSLKAARDPLLEEMILDLMPSLRRMQYLTFSLRGDILAENLEIIERGNGYLQQGSAEMAVNTVIEYITKEKAVALDTIETQLQTINQRLSTLPAIPGGKASAAKPPKHREAL